VVKLVDTQVSGTCGGNPVEVQVLSSAPGFVLLADARRTTPWQARLLITRDVQFTLNEACHGVAERERGEDGPALASQTIISLPRKTD
jgi:hypothetical protein